LDAESSLPNSNTVCEFLRNFRVTAGPVAVSGSKSLLWDLKRVFEMVPRSARKQKFCI
jgi:hypothetical protein